MRKLFAFFVVAVLASFLAARDASAFMIFSLDFEGLSDYTPVTNQYAPQYVTFSDAIAITAGFSLNEFDFPPRSGQNVLFNETQSMWLDFGLTTYDWSAYLTYASPVTVNAYDGDGNLVGTTGSLFSENFVSSGNSPNELLALSIASGFSSLQITGGDPSGSSFVVDDMSYKTADAIPEPATLILFGAGVLGLAIRRHKRTIS